MSNFRLPLQGIISTNNSSTSAINTGFDFTGTWEDVSGFNTTTVAVKTDQNGYFEVQYSPDGTNVDLTLTKQYRTTQIEAPHVYVNAHQYMRVVFYNNSGTNQTFFRLQVTLGDRGQLNIPGDSTMAQDYDAISVRPTEYTHEVALGRRQGATTWNKFGYNTGVGTTAELLASWGGTFQFLTTGETIDIVSSDVNDIVTTGTGARSVVIYGVDSNWDEQIEVVNMNGTTTVTTSSTWIGINRVSISVAGSTRGNVGTIDITASTSGFQMAQMPVGASTTEQCIFYVAQSHQFLATYLRLSAIKASGGGNPAIDFKGYVYSAVSNVIYNVFDEDLDTQVREYIEMSPSEPFIIGEKSILWFEATGSAASTSVKGRFSGKLIRDVGA